MAYSELNCLGSYGCTSVVNRCLNSAYSFRCTDTQRIWTNPGQVYRTVTLSVVKAQPQAKLYRAMLCHGLGNVNESSKQT